MLFSLYPTDPADVRDAVVAAARDHSAEQALFTSLHIPEADDLASFADYLRGLHERDGLTFCADISPLTLNRLGIELDGVDDPILGRLIGLDPREPPPPRPAAPAAAPCVRAARAAAAIRSANRASR